MKGMNINVSLKTKDEVRKKFGAKKRAAIAKMMTSIEESSRQHSCICEILNSDERATREQVGKRLLMQTVLGRDGCRGGGVGCHASPSNFPIGLGYARRLVDELGLVTMRGYLATLQQQPRTHTHAHTHTHTHTHTHKHTNIHTYRE